MTEFLASFNASAMETWGVALCFLALPVGLVVGWCWESWKDRHECEGDSQ
jgi:hypothetical protein